MKSQVNKRNFYTLLEAGVEDEPYYSIGCKSEQMLNKWSKSKENLFKLFGDKLKVSIPMETTADIDIYMESIGNLEEELKDNASFNLVRIIARSFLKGGNLTVDEVVGNIIKGRDVTIGGRTFKIGSKITKMFSALVPKDLKNEFNIVYSRFLQSLQTTGKLVISIDPVDFLTMSENKSNWSSCHSIYGEFRAGTLSYMLDEHTAIAYLSSNNEAHYEEYGIDWNNKKWRQVVHIDTLEEVFIQGKHYPAQNSMCLEGVQDMLVKMMRMKEPEVTGSVHKIQSLLQDYYNDEYVDETLHYNDIVRNWDSGDGIVAVAEKGLDLYALDTMFVGSEVRCLNDDCDELVDYSNHFLCSDCTDYDDY